jgi:cytoskeletal protein RodZ
MFTFIPASKGTTTKVAAIAALGLAGFLSVTACSTTTTPAAAPTAPHSLSAPTQQAQQAAQQAAQPAQQASQPAEDASPTPDQVAQWVAGIAVGNDALTALQGDDGTATSAECDPSTVSNPADVNTPTSASCNITYSDGSDWQQTVTITFDSQGNPVADSTNVGIEESQPTS